MKCDMNCGRDAYFHEGETGIAVCEECWKVIDAVAVHCVSEYLKDVVVEKPGVEIKSPFKFRALK
jgi:hypothetical protein